MKNIFNFLLVLLIIGNLIFLVFQSYFIYTSSNQISNQYYYKNLWLPIYHNRVEDIVPYKRISGLVEDFKLLGVNEAEITIKVDYWDENKAKSEKVKFKFDNKTTIHINDTNTGQINILDLDIFLDQERIVGEVVIVNFLKEIELFNSNSYLLKSFGIQDFPENEQI